MKIRNCFVSNSSSSSFVLFVPKEEHEAIMSQLKEWERDIVEQIGFDNTSFMGVDLIVIATMNTPGWSIWEDILVNERLVDFKKEKIAEEDKEDSLADMAYEAWDNYKKLARKGKCLSHRVDM